MNISRQIGWSQESNLLYQILKQLNKLTSIMFGLKPKYKVYTALLTQSGGNVVRSLVFNDIPGGPDLVIGVTYSIEDNSGGLDMTNVGAPNNNFGTYFVATGIRPNNWGIGYINYNEGAPIVTVLENTIGNIWFTYDAVGNYSINSDYLFINNKTYTVFQTWGDDNVTNRMGVVYKNSDSQLVLNNTDYLGVPSNSIGGNTALTSIEIRVYN